MSETKEDYAIAVDIGGTNLRIAKVTRSYEYEFLVLQKTPRENKTEIIDQIVRVVELCTRKMQTPPCGIGISAAGKIDPVAGIMYPPNLPYDEISLRSPLQEKICNEIVVSLLNDCRAGVLGERYAGAGKEHEIENMVYISFSTGIGTGALCNSHLILGSHGNAGELGHIPARTRYISECSCNISGHFEGYASGFGIPRFFAQFCEQEGVPPDPISGAEEIFDRAAEKDSIAMQFLDEVASITASGIFTAIVAYDPALIVIEGPIMRKNPWFLELCLSKIEPYFHYIPEIVLSFLNGYAPLIGSTVPLFERSDLQFQKKNESET